MIPSDARTDGGRWSGRVRKLVATTLAAVAGISLLPAVAHATSTVKGGNAEYDVLKLTSGDYMFVASTVVDVDINYYNGVGIGGNDLVYMRLVDNRGNKFADTRLIREHDRYRLGNDVLGTTRFKIEYRRASNNTSNPYWEGTVIY